MIQAMIFDLDGALVQAEKLKAPSYAKAAIDLFPHAVRGQYEGYALAEGVAKNTMTPTYAALKLQIDNWRWQGAPFYLRPGKALKKKTAKW